MQTYISCRLSNLLDSSENSVKLDFDEKNNWHLYCTNKRAITIKERLTNLNGNSIHVKDENGKVLSSFVKDDFSFKKKDKGSTVIEIGFVNNLSKKLQTIQNKLIKLNKKKWAETNNQIYNKYSPSRKIFF